MRIQIVSSNGTTYVDNIAPLKKASSKTTEKSDKTATDEEFSKILEEFKDKILSEVNSLKGSSENLNTGADAGANTSASTGTTASQSLPPYTGKIPEILSEKSSDKIFVGTTKEGYESIAPAEYQAFFKEAAETFGIDQKLIELIGFHESRFLPDVTSKSGAMGIMQLMPSTALSMGVTNAYDAYENIMGGTKLLKQLSDAYGGDLDLMLAGYSAGMGAVKKYNGVPPYEETLNYIEWIRERYS